MHFVLDTNVWLWWLNNGPELSLEARSILENPAHGFVVSSVSVWEVVIKRQIGKLTIDGDPYRATIERNCTVIPFTAHHALAVAELPLHHRDPFDRALLAQALSDGTRLLTGDQALRAYADVVPLTFVTS